MPRTQKQQPNKTIPVKIASLILGFSFWFVISNLQTITLNVTVPVCFYNVPEQYTITDAPETITVTLRGKKRTVRNLDYTQLALHVDGTLLTPGKQAIALCSDTLLLPHDVTVTAHTPSNPTMLVQRIS